MPFIRLLLAAFVFLLAGCDQQALLDKLTPQEEVALSKRLIAQLAARDFPAIEQQLDPSLNDPAIRGKLQQLAEQFPSSLGLHVNPLPDSLQNITDGWAAPVAPMVLAVSIPLGAVMFFVRRSQWLAQARDPSQDIS